MTLEGGSECDAPHVAVLSRVSFQDSDTFPLTEHLSDTYCLYFNENYRQCSVARVALRATAETPKCSFCASQTRNNAATLSTHLSCLKFHTDRGG